MFDCDYLEYIIDEVRAKIILANRKDELETLLNKWGLEDLLPHSSKYFYDTPKNGKIVVLGGSQVKESDLLGIVKSLNLDKHRFEFCLDYNDLESYQFTKLRYNPNYRLVMVGPMPHSTSGKGDSRSTIAEMEQSDGFPKVVRLGSNELKITKSSFKTALQEQIDKNYI